MMTDELLIKFLLNETSEAESRLVRDWIAASPANLNHYSQFEKIWKTSKNLAANRPVDVEQAWVNFQQKAAGVGKPAIKPLNPLAKWSSIAAVFALVLGIWLVYTVWRPENYKEILAGNRVKTELLPDGSELTLNKHASISYAEDFKDNRHLKFQKGSIFFNVAHDKSRPFVIDIDEVAVTVVGTSFHIRHLKGETEVIVETGIVRVRRNGEELELRQGEKVLIAETTAKLIKARSTDQLYNYYRSQLFIAEGIPLKKLTSTLNEAYNANIQIPDEQLAAEPIYTTLKAEDGLSENIKTICRTLDLKASITKDQISLSRTK